MQFTRPLRLFVLCLFYTSVGSSCLLIMHDQNFHHIYHGFAVQQIFVVVKSLHEDYMFSPKDSRPTCKRPFSLDEKKVL